MGVFEVPIIAMHREEGRSRTNKPGMTEGLQDSRKQRHGRVLVVDDDQIVINAVRRILQRSGMDPESTTDARKALDIYKKGGIDLVISDRQMPGMDGLELLKVLKEFDPKVKVIIVSGGISEKQTEEFLEAGASAVLEKVSMIKTLIKAVKRVLES